MLRVPLDDVTPNAIHRNQILHFPPSGWLKVFGRPERVRLDYIVNVLFSSAMSELVVWKDNVRFPWWVLLNINCREPMIKYNH